MADDNKQMEGKKKKSLWKKILILTFLLGLTAMLTGGGLFTYYASQAPAMNEKALVDPIPTEILDMNGNLITTIGAKKHQLVTYEEIPSLVENAVLATEDVRFYEHAGVDPLRLGAAVIANIKDGFGAQGGSTITQQVIKRSFLTSKKSLERKAQEAWLAVKFERNHSKEEILELYLNKTYYSDNIYGIETAARYYYNKHLDELTLAQTALLAGIPQSPNNYNPYVYPKRAETRRNTVLALMKQHEKITEEEMINAQQTPITEGLVKRTKATRNQLATEDGYQAFIDVVINQLEKEDDYDLYQDGLRVHTTLDPNAQAQVEKILNSDEIIDYPKPKNEQPFQAGLTVLDTQSGAVRAIGGGRNYGKETKRGFNFAMDIKRQPGSVIKPLLAYAPAIEKMQWSTAHILEDEPFEYKTGQKPQNWDGEFKGPITIREALWDSRNIPAIKAFNETGHEYATEFINKLGLDIKETLYESAAIGGIRSNLDTMEIAGAYAAFGNGGTYHEPHIIKKIEFHDGSSVDIKHESHQAMESHTAYMITDMLKDVIEHPKGTGKDARVPGLPVAGKSGTTNYSEAMREEYNIDADDAPDSWFVGYTTNYTTAVWTGYKDLTNYLTQAERKTSEKIFSEVMKRLAEETETPDFERPDNVIEVKIEKGTTPPELASESTEEDAIITELFIEGTEPSEDDDDSEEASKDSDSETSDEDKDKDEQNSSNDEKDTNEGEQNNSDDERNANESEQTDADAAQADGDDEQNSSDNKQDVNEDEQNVADAAQADIDDEQNSSDNKQDVNEDEQNVADAAQADVDDEQNSSDDEQDANEDERNVADAAQADVDDEQNSSDDEQDANEDEQNVTDAAQADVDNEQNNSDDEQKANEDEQTDTDNAQADVDDEQNSSDNKQNANEDEQNVAGAAQADGESEQNSSDDEQDANTEEQNDVEDQQNSSNDEQKANEDEQADADDDQADVDDEQSSSDNKQNANEDEQNDAEPEAEDDRTEQTTSEEE